MAFTGHVMAHTGQMMAHPGQTSFQGRQREVPRAAGDVPGWLHGPVCRDGSEGTHCSTRAGEWVPRPFGQGSAQ